MDNQNTNRITFAIPAAMLEQMIAASEPGAPATRINDLWFDLCDRAHLQIVSIKPSPIGFAYFTAVRLPDRPQAH